MTAPARFGDLIRPLPARSIDDVLSIMTTIDGTLPDDDGLKWFNRLYLQVTLGVRESVAGATFADAAFMAALDVVFANLYFSAIVCADDDLSSAPSAWRPLLAMRHQSSIARLQFALAGMNAHINRDLPVGIVSVFESLGGDPVTDVRHREDFDRVNDLLERVEGEVKTEFSRGLIGVVDKLAGRVDDVVAMWNVRKARAAAWTNAEILWTLRPARPLHDRFLDRLDGLTRLASSGLLLPTGLR
jgi:hypothetical protein